MAVVYVADQRLPAFEQDRFAVDVVCAGDIGKTGCSAKVVAIGAESSLHLCRHLERLHRYVSNP